MRQARKRREAAERRAKEAADKRAGLKPAKKAEVPEEERPDDEKKDARDEVSATRGLGRQPIPPADTVRFLHRLDHARKSGDDARRTARRKVGEANADRVPKKEAAAARAAVELVWLDFAARRYCEPVGACLSENRVSGSRLSAAIRAADDSADRGLKRLRAANPRWHAGYDVEEQEAARAALVVAAVVRNEHLVEPLLEAAALAEKYRPPRQVNEDDDKKEGEEGKPAEPEELPEVPPDAHPERERQAFVLALVLCVVPPPRERERERDRRRPKGTTRSTRRTRAASRRARTRPRGSRRARAACRLGR